MDGAPLLITRRTHKFPGVCSFWAQDGMVAIYDERPDVTKPDDRRQSYETPLEMFARARALGKEAIRARQEGNRSEADQKARLVKAMLECIKEAHAQGSGFWSEKSARERTEQGRRIWGSTIGLNLPGLRAA